MPATGLRPDSPVAAAVLGNRLFLFGIYDTGKPPESKVVVVTSTDDTLVWTPDSGGIRRRPRGSPCRRSAVGRGRDGVRRPPVPRVAMDGSRIGVRPGTLRRGELQWRRGQLVGVAGAGVDAQVRADSPPLWPRTATTSMCWRRSLAPAPEQKRPYGRTEALAAPVTLAPALYSDAADQPANA